MKNEKRFRVEFCLIGEYPAGSIRVVVTKSADDRDRAVIESAKELMDKGQYPSFVSAWEVKND